MLPIMLTIDYTLPCPSYSICYFNASLAAGTTHDTLGAPSYARYVSDVGQTSNLSIHLLTALA